MIIFFAELVGSCGFVLPSIIISMDLSSETQPQNWGEGWGRRWIVIRMRWKRVRN